MNPRSLEITSKLQGKIMGTQQIEVSTDLKTLTMTIRQTGKGSPNTFCCLIGNRHVVRQEHAPSVGT